MNFSERHFQKLTDVYLTICGAVMMYSVQSATHFWRDVYFLDLFQPREKGQSVEPESHALMARSPPCSCTPQVDVVSREMLAATARKGLTLAVSFLFFPKPLTLTHAGGMLLFFVGLVWNSHLRHQEKERARAAKEAGTPPKKRD